MKSNTPFLGLNFADNAQPSSDFNFRKAERCGKRGKTMSYKKKSALMVACMLAIGVASAPQGASAQSCGASSQQKALTRPIPLGVSGGNIHSFIRKKVNNKVKGCFSGTLGAMVQDPQNVQYILSNNHVLADQNKAKPGDLVVQPGLVDVKCIKAQSDSVATFSRAINLKFGSNINNVDAAIAAVQPGQVSPDILFIGPIAGTTATPTVGLAVQKMGRTSCLTTGVIAALDANLSVNYSETQKPKLAKFSNQILVTGSISTPQFGVPGDSGSLIVTDDSCPRAVGLLFAGSSGGPTIANPISSVLSSLGVSMVGSCTPAVSTLAQADVEAQTIGLSTADVASAKAIRDRHEDSLMRVPGAVGTGIGTDGSGHPSIEVYVKKLTTQAQAAASTDVEGLPVKVIETGEFTAY